MELKQYIECVKKLEIEKYTLTKTIQAMDQKINNLAIPRRVIRETNKPAQEKPIDFGCGCGLGVWGTFFTIMGLSLFGLSELGIGVGLLFLLIGIPAFIYLIYLHKSHSKLVEQTDQQIAQKYTQEIKYEKQRMELETEQKNRFIQARQTLNSTYQKTCNTLQELYDKNIIYPKYQNNLVAICMFSEYLQSRRCNTLEGPNGAYNIFESEIRLGLILGKLDEISSKLDQISNSQYMLYTALNQINNQQSRIIGNLNRMIANQEAQQEQLEYIEYNTRVLKQNSDIELMLRKW